MREQHPAGLIGNSAASWQFWAAWHVTAAVTVAVTPIRARLGPVWEFSTDTFLVVGGLLLTYAGSIALLAQRARSDRRIDFRTLIATIAPAITLFLLFLVLVRPKYSRPVVLVSLMLVPTFAILATRISPRFRTVALTAVLVFALAGFVPRVSHTHERPSAAENNVVASGLYSLTVSSYPLDLGAQEVTGGAIALLGDAYVLSEGDGELYALSWDRETKRLESRRLRSRVPLNREEFIRDTSNNPSIDSGVFRTADILIQQNEDTFQLFAAHHHWNTAKKCFTVRVSATNGTVRAFLQGERPQDWRSVYESAPCLTFKKTGNPFVGYQIGGQLELLDSNHLLLALGDHGLDGVNDEDRVSQDESTSYGKIVLIDLITGASSTFSRGHRNPQGLHVDPQGEIWSTEHGPRGGDELNLIRHGANYGWPFVTYGANYQTNEWPLNAEQGRHDGFQSPVYAWIPSISTSSVMSVTGKLFVRWAGDLIVTSMYGSLWRVRIEHGRALFTERIDLQGRWRDAVEDSHGRLVLWDETRGQAKVVVVEPVDGGERLTDPRSRQGTSPGQLLFVQRCAACHRSTDSGTIGIAPGLGGIYGRPVAESPGYAYSEALKRVDGVWADANLDAFLADPQKFAPGNWMQSEPVTDTNARASLIAYLKTVK